MRLTFINFKRFVTMTEPVIAALKPAIVTLKAGQTVYWCSCGKSATQPFCDGAHMGTEFEPVVFKAPKDDTYYFCQCKHTKNVPFCDGSHKSLPGFELPG